MGAGEVGFHMARELSREGHDVVVIERDPGQRERVEELDVAMVTGNGAHLPVLEAAQVGSADLFMAVSSNDEANLAASLLARRLGAERSVVRVGETKDVTINRRTYEEAFRTDLLLSTQLLATTRILNHILGHNTVAVEYLARGKVQLRKIRIERGSVLTRRSLAELAMPQGSLVVALFRGAELVVPSGKDRAEAGDDALILGKTEVIDRAERLLAHRPQTRGTVVIGVAARPARPWPGPWPARWTECASSSRTGAGPGSSPPARPTSKSCTAMPLPRTSRCCAPQHGPLWRFRATTSAT